MKISDNDDLNVYGYKCHDEISVYIIPPIISSIFLNVPSISSAYLQKTRSALFRTLYLGGGFDPGKIKKFAKTYSIVMNRLAT